MRLKLNQEIVEKRLKNIGVEYDNFEYDGYKTKITYKCLVCGDKKTSTLNHIMRQKNICKKCRNNILPEQVKIRKSNIIFRLNNMNVEFKDFEYLGINNTNIYTKCPICTTWGLSKLYKILYGTRNCKKCKKNRKRTQEESEKILIDLGVEFLPFIYKNNTTRITHKCKKCGKLKTSYYQSIVDKKCFCCNKCGDKNKIRTSQKNAEKQLCELGVEFLPFTYINNRTKITFKCKKCGKLKTSTYSSLVNLRCKHICRNCIIGYYITQKKAEENLTKLNIRFLPFTYITSTKTVVPIKCSKCDKVVNKKYHHLISIERSLLCKRCQKTTSEPENQIKDFIRGLGYDIYENMKIDGKEIDIFIETKMIGVEFDGTYYHSTKVLTKKYKGIKNIITYKNRFVKKYPYLSGYFKNDDINNILNTFVANHNNFKTLICSKNKIQLIHIKESDWKKNKKGVLNYIKNVFDTTVPFVG